MSLAERITRRQVGAERLACWWLGGSGVVFKSASGAVVYVDPYLSDSVNGIFGVGRMFPPPIVPEEVRAEAIVSTHWHEDHLEPGTIPVIAKSDAGAKFFMPPTAMSRAMGWGVPGNRIIAMAHGESQRVGADITSTATPARHEARIPGWEVPDAMGVVVE